MALSLSDFPDPRAGTIPRVARACLAALLLMVGPAGADIVSLAMPNGLTARADYRPGLPDRPTILILHGFLQTHDFPTVYRLSEGLHGEGYTTLAPTLSLGIPQRRQSMACEAIHTHTLDDDLDEIDAWVKWLRARRHAPIVLVGHSTGSMELLAYLSTRHPQGVARMIGVSIVEGRLELDKAGHRRLAKDLRGRIKAGDRQPIRRQLSYCKEYLATPASLFSYLEWSPERILTAIGESRVPIAFIMGSRDDRLGPGWTDRLRKTGKPVAVIQGASHFMDGEYEFDLLDQILADLK